ncbi:MAG: hypothetical protein NTY51_07420 [Deltaproteobacteria bacterium]|nr:hypothetical protein [Deltaproteobacteria bacterium]
MSILSSAILSIEILSSAVIFGYCVAGFAVFLQGRDRLRTQILVANGTLLGMNLKLVGALLKTIELQTWNQLALFVVIFALKTVIKKVFLRQNLISTKQVS